MSVDMIVGRRYSKIWPASKFYSESLGKHVIVPPSEVKYIVNEITENGTVHITFDNGCNNMFNLTSEFHETSKLIEE